MISILAQVAAGQPLPGHSVWFVEFTRDWVPILALVVSIVGLVAVFAGIINLKLIHQQIDLSAKQLEQASEAAKESMRWNKNQAHHTFFASVPNPETTNNLVKELVAAKLDPEVPVTEETYQVIKQNHMLRVAVIHYLNDFEELCGAVQCATVDENLAYGLDCTSVITAFKRYRVFIVNSRKRLGSDTLYIELEKTATKWESRRLSEKQEIEKKKLKIEQERAELDRQQGIQRTF